MQQFHLGKYKQEDIFLHKNVNKKNIPKNNALFKNQEEKEKMDKRKKEGKR